MSVSGSWMAESWERREVQAVLLLLVLLKWEGWEG